MRVSLRVKLYQAIRDYCDCRDRLKAIRDASGGSADDAVVEKELDKREEALTIVWKECFPEMNVLERRRYIDIIGKPLGGEDCPIPASPVKEYPPEVLEVLAKVQKVFPGAKIYEPGRHDVRPDLRPRRPSEDLKAVIGVKRDRPAPEPPAPQQPEQLGLM